MLRLRAIALLASVLVFTACTSIGAQSPIASPSAARVSMLPTPTSPPPTATLLPTDVPTSTPTPVPTRTPEPTLLPTLTSQELSPETVAQMAVWRVVKNEASFTLYQVSDAPLGVTSVEWSPGDANLWLNMATGPGGWGNFADTTSLVTNRETHAGWKPSDRGDSFVCYRSHDWSPNGKLVAYVQNGHVWLASTDGQNQRALVLPVDVEDVAHPQFSPTGRLLATTTARTDQDGVYYGIAVYDVALGELVRVIDIGGYPVFAWSPQGDAIAALRSDRNVAHARLAIVDISTGQLVTADLAEFAAGEGCLPTPSWILNGQKVLAGGAATQGVWVVDRTGQVERLSPREGSQRNLRSVGLAAPLYGGSCYAASPSPDGSYTVYMAGGNNLLIRNLETNQGTAIDQGDLCYGRTKINWAPHRPQFLRWGDDLRGGQLPLDLVSAIDGSVTQLVAHAQDPAWSPDGQRIAYWSRHADGLTLNLLDVGTGETAVLVSPNPQDLQERRPYEYDVTPHWSADGKSIAFVSWREDLPEAYVVQVP